MQKKRMFRDAKTAKFLLPAWLSPTVAFGFTILGPIIAGIVIGLIVTPIMAIIINTSYQESYLLTDLTALQAQFADTFMILELALFSFISGMVFLWVRFVEGRPVVTLGFYKDKWWKDLLKGLGIGLLLFAVVLLILVLLGAYRLENLTLTPYAFGFALLILPFWFLQGGTEELVTRGWLLPVMAAKSNRALAIAVSSSLFGLLHMANSGFSLLPFLNLILFGMMMALYLIKTDNIWGVAGIHAAWNFAQGNLFGILVSGQSAGTSLSQFIPGNAPDWLTGGAFGVEGSIVTVLVQFAVVLYLIYQLKSED